MMMDDILAAKQPKLKPPNKPKKPTLFFRFWIFWQNIFAKIKKKKFFLFAFLVYIFCCGRRLAVFRANEKPLVRLCIPLRDAPPPAG